MLFEFTPDHREFREEVCAFLTAELSPDVYSRHRDGREWSGWSVEYRRAFRRRLGERGYISMGWPAEHGGGGRDITYSVILAEEIEYHGAPGLEAATTHMPYTLMSFGTEEQKAFFLPRLRRGELTIFLAYSEPDAGSDLASLKTRAVEQEGGFVVTGQKIYSSFAHFADYGLVAACTDPTSTRHSGISLLLADMRSPGISIAQYDSVAGFHHHAVHFDRVWVPRNMLLGPLHQGWKVLMSAVDRERAAIGAPGLVDRQLDRLLALCMTPDESGGRLLADPVVRDRLVTLAVEAEAARLYAYGIAERQARGERPQHETSLLLLLRRETARLADVIGLELLGPYGQLRGDSPHSRHGGAIEQEYREHLYFHFAAGGFDIVRNVIALRGLRLPR